MGKKRKVMGDKRCGENSIAITTPAGDGRSAGHDTKDRGKE
jgi:hypothetical protein